MFYKYIYTRDMPMLSGVYHKGLVTEMTSWKKLEAKVTWCEVKKSRSGDTITSSFYCLFLTLFYLIFKIV